MAFSFCPGHSQGNQNFADLASHTLHDQILTNATWAMSQQPETVTSARALRSAGGIHDFYSEGDYWWPDSADLSGPYIQRDGLTNPDNFTAHRKALIRFSQIIGALTSAYLITKDEKYILYASLHFNTWFINEDTYMSPNLLYAQAIKGKVTGRGIGIIDTIHLMEVAQGMRVMEQSGLVDRPTIVGVKNWFSTYLQWLTTHPYGLEEMSAKNNHGTCWVMQVATFAKLTGDQKLIEFCKDRYMNVLLPNQMAADGSFPLELKRTKPFAYSIFNLDAMTMICQILSDSLTDLWKYKTDDGKSIANGVKFLYPFIEDKSKWPHQHDVMYWDQWPVAQPSLLFAAHAFRKTEWFETWKEAEHQPTEDEIIRNLPIRNPLIWFNEYIGTK